MNKFVSLLYVIIMVIVVCSCLVSCKNEQKAGPAPVAAPMPAVPAPSRREQLLKTEFRAIYITSWTAGIRRFNALLDMVTRSHLNAMVIDIKDSTGKVGYDSKVPLVAQTGAYEKRIRDLDGILKQCRDKKVYTIARIAVFQDPNLAKRLDPVLGGRRRRGWRGLYPGWGEPEA